MVFLLILYESLRTTRIINKTSCNRAYIPICFCSEIDLHSFNRSISNWYTGKHEPLITKELYDQVQEQIKASYQRVENKEFAFTKLMFCGLCGSGITADEKFKHMKNGKTHRYVYYGCSKSKDRNCKCGYLEEKELIKQFQGLIETIDLNEIEVKEKIKDEIDRFSKMQKFFLGIKEQVKIPNIDIRGYAKYVLREGSDLEKRELLNCLKNKILLKEKQISIEMI